MTDTIVCVLAGLLLSNVPSFLAKRSFSSEQKKITGFGKGRITVDCVTGCASVNFAT